MINVLLSISGVNRVRKTFFRRSIYTRSDKSDSGFYAQVATDTMRDVEDMKIVCSVTSDNTSACEVAKAKLACRYNWLISWHDQSYLANLLMQDIGGLTVLKKLSM